MLFNYVLHTLVFISFLEKRNIQKSWKKSTGEVGPQSGTSKAFVNIFLATELFQN